MRLISLLMVAAARANTELAPWQRVVASATGYFFGQLAATPLDVVKTKVQANPSKMSPARSFGIIRDIARGEGLRGFYRGFGPTLLMMPGVIVQYTIYDELRLKDLGPPVAASIASFVDVTVRCPFEKLKTVAQAGAGSRLVMTVPALWQGYGSQLLRDIPYASLYWTFYDRFKAWLHVDDENLKSSKGIRTFVAGFAAAAIAATVVTPVDVVKTRVQIAPPGALNPASAVRAILIDQGFPGLFAGLPARLLRIPLYNAVVIATFELAKDYFADDINLSFSASAASPESSSSSSSKVPSSG